MERASISRLPSAGDMLTIGKWQATGAIFFVPNETALFRRDKPLPYSPPSNTVDRALPRGMLARAPDRNFYGTTDLGGLQRCLQQKGLTGARLHRIVNLHSKSIDLLWYYLNSSTQTEACFE